MHTDARLLRGLAIAGVCVVSLVVACGLAYWQWERYSSTGGSMQNLGYVLQWPLFGLFPAFVFWRIRRLSQAEEGSEPRAAERPRTPRQRRSGADWAATQRGASAIATARSPMNRTATSQTGNAAQGVRGTAEDEELAAYNRYLAELNARDHHD